METEKINKYQNGKIYCIRSPSTDKIYIGSTIEPYLSNRFGGHKRDFKHFLNGNKNNISSFELIKLGDAYIELLESFPCNSKLELHKREGELIREHRDMCVNKVIAGRSKKEWKIDNKEAVKKHYKTYCESNKEKMNKHSKQYYENNKETMNKHMKEYRINNKEKIQQYFIDNKETIKEQKKQYRNNNKEILNEKKKQNYEKNKEIIAQKRKTKYICECGSEINISDKSRHNKSIKHINFLIL